MNEEEKEIQKALGLLKTYNGFVSVQGQDYFDVYAVRDVTEEGAREQLDRIVKVAQKKSKVLLELKFIADDPEKLFGGLYGDGRSPHLKN